MAIAENQRSQPPTPEREKETGRRGVTERERGRGGGGRREKEREGEGRKDRRRGGEREKTVSHVIGKRERGGRAGKRERERERQRGEGEGGREGGGGGGADKQSRNSGENIRDGEWYVNVNQSVV